MSVVLINHREQFEILPSVCVARLPKCWILMISWGTVTIDIEFERAKD